MRRRVPVVVLSSILFLPAGATAQTTALFIDSEPGEYLGQGVDQTLTPPASTFSVFADSTRFNLSTFTGSVHWLIQASSAPGTTLEPGLYAPTTNQFYATAPRLELFSSGRSCQLGTGRFVLYELAFDTNLTVSRLAADIEYHCNDAAPGLFVALRYNSTISDLTPFEGNSVYSQP